MKPLVPMRAALCDPDLFPMSDPKLGTVGEAVEAKPYTPTAFEVDAAQAYVVARKKSGPRLKVSTSDKGSMRVDIDHPDLAIGQVALMKAIGTTDTEFYTGLVRQLINVGSQGQSAEEDGANFMLSVVKGLAPRDQIEAMLGAQMAAVHDATMTFARRLAHVDNIQQQDSAQTAFNKLARTFAAQVSALKDYRSKGEQKMTVQHVHVAEGGQAIVGNVSAPAAGGGVHEKVGVQPHALAYAPGVEMPRQVEAERATVPRAGGSGV
ncbi:MAG TPA: hypothetical protein VKA12_10000 [Roseiarcus sp.]|nr:hypothetical protein [Roseiarcus sp.]